MYYFDSASTWREHWGGKVYSSSHEMSKTKQNIQKISTQTQCVSLCKSPIPGILQARTLEWVAISFSNA